MATAATCSPSIARMVRSPRKPAVEGPGGIFAVEAQRQCVKWVRFLSAGTFVILYYILNIFYMYNHKILIIL